MAGSIIQAPAPTIDDSGATSTTHSATLTGVTAGSTLVAHVGYGNTSNPSGVSNGTAFTHDPKGVLADPGNSQNDDCWYLENVASGSHTITVTWPSAVPFRRLRVYELGGVATASALDKSEGQFLAGPGTSTDAYTSGVTATTANANDFILGVAQNTGEGEPGSSVISAGTSFTIASPNDNIMTGEGRNVSATGAYAATFTATISVSRTVRVLIFKQAAGAADTLMGQACL